jgi:hypothetical protein
MTHLQKTIYNRVSVAAVYERRSFLASALREARALGDRAFVRRCIWHAEYVGWPIRKRPNGSFN